MTVVTVIYPAAAPDVTERGLGVPGPQPPGTDPEPRTCSATTKAGEPCKGRAGDDGLCAAHKDT